MHDAPLEISRLGFLGDRPIGRLAYGCWRFAGASLADSQAKIEAALEIGVVLIDTADIYGSRDGGIGASESALGELIETQPGLRDQLVVATKGGVSPPHPNNSCKSYLVGACEASLRRLKIETIDLYLIHRPDLLTSHREVADALSELRQSGKIGAAGVSNYSVSQTRALQSQLDFPLVATQPEISPLAIGPLLDGTLDQAQELALTPLAWSPLAGGQLVQEMTAVTDPKTRRVRAEIERIATANGCGRDAVILAWLMAHPAGIVPIIGSQNPQRIRSAGAAYGVKMTRRDWYAVLEASRGEKMP